MEQKELKRFLLKNSIYALALLFAFVLGEIPSINPNMPKGIPIVPLLVAIAMTEGEFYGGLFGFFSGILIDSMASHIFGIASIFFTIIGCACGLLVIYLMQNNLRTTVILSVVVSIVYGIVSYYIIYGMWAYEGSNIFLFRRTIPMVFVNTLWSVPAYFFVLHIYSKIRV